MYLKVVRMFSEGFGDSALDSIFIIKIMVLRLFCAVDYIVKMPNCKMNEIANVCELRNSFVDVMLVGVRMDNMTAESLIC